MLLTLKNLWVWFFFLCYLICLSLNTLQSVGQVFSIHGLCNNIAPVNPTFVLVWCFGSSRALVIQLSNSWRHFSTAALCLSFIWIYNVHTKHKANPYSQETMIQPTELCVPSHPWPMPPQTGWFCKHVITLHHLTDAIVAICILPENLIWPRAPWAKRRECRREKKLRTLFKLAFGFHCSGAGQMKLTLFYYAEYEYETLNIKRIRDKKTKHSMDIPSTGDTHLSLQCASREENY